jgi:hypothetical protein
MEKLDGTCEQKREIYDVWAVRIWDNKNDHEIVLAIRRSRHFL